MKKKKEGIKVGQIVILQFLVRLLQLPPRMISSSRSVAPSYVYRRGETRPQRSGSGKTEQRVGRAAAEGEDTRARRVEGESGNYAKITSP